MASMNTRSKSKSKKSTRKTRKREPDIKRPMTSYMWFVREQRPKYVRDHPDAKFTEVGQALGCKWSQMRDEEKRKYADMAEQDKERYRREMDQEFPQRKEAETKRQKERVRQKAASIDQCFASAYESPMMNVEIAVISLDMPPRAMEKYRETLLGLSSQAMSVFVCALHILVSDETLDADIRRKLDQTFRYHSGVSQANRPQFPSVTYETLQQARQKYQAFLAGNVSHPHQNKRQKK